MRSSLVRAEVQTCSSMQRVQLKTLLQLRQKLKTDPPPEAVKGLKGMQKAHQTLQENNSVGALIGGLAETIWKCKRAKDLSRRKDVDVILLDENYRPDSFKHGIDWWVPQNGTVDYTSKDKTTKVNGAPVKWWENGNGVMLTYRVDQKQELQPGLYILHTPWVIALKELETLASVDPEIEISECAIEDFVDKLRDKIYELSSTICSPLGDIFRGFILHPCYYMHNAVLPDSLKITPLLWEEQSAIKLKYETRTI